MTSGSMTTSASCSRPSRRSPASASREAAHSPPPHLVQPGLHVAADRARRAGPAARAAAAPGGAPSRCRSARRAAARRTGSAGSPASAVRAQDQRVARILARQGAGQHDAGRQLGFQILQAVHREVDPAVQQRLVDFLGEQALAADIGQPLPVAALASPVVRMACSWNTSMPRSTGQNRVSRCEEGAGLHQRQRRARGCRPAAAAPRWCALAPAAVGRSRGVADAGSCHGSACRRRHVAHCSPLVAHAPRTGAFEPHDGQVQHRRRTTPRQVGHQQPARAARDRRQRPAISASDRQPERHHLGQRPVRPAQAEEQQLQSMLSSALTREQRRACAAAARGRDALPSEHAGERRKREDQRPGRRRTASPAAARTACAGRNTRARDRSAGAAERRHDAAPQPAATRIGRRVDSSRAPCPNRCARSLKKIAHMRHRLARGPAPCSCRLPRSAAARPGRGRS